MVRRTRVIQDTCTRFVPLAHCLLCRNRVPRAAFALGWCAGLGAPGTVVTQGPLARQRRTHCCERHDPARAEVTSWQRHHQNVPTTSSLPGPVWSLQLPVTVWVSWVWARPGRVSRRTTPVAVPATPTAKAIPEVVPSA